MQTPIQHSLCSFSHAYRGCAAKTIALLLLAVTTNALAEEAPYTYTRIGVGYAYQDATNVLVQPLPRARPASSRAIPVAQLPDSCFKDPGITKIQEFEARSQSEIRRVLEGVAGTGKPIIVTCGEASAPTAVFVEVSRDADSWLIDDSPADHILNHHLKRLLENFARFKKEPPPVLKDGLYEYTNANGERTFAATVTKSNLFFVLDVDHEEDQANLLSELAASGRKSLAGKADDIADYRVIINYGRLDASKLFDQLRGFWKDVHDTALRANDLEIARLEKEIRELDRKIEAHDNIEKILDEEKNR